MDTRTIEELEHDLRAGDRVEQLSRPDLDRIRGLGRRRRRTRRTVFTALGTAAAVAGVAVIGMSVDPGNLSGQQATDLGSPVASAPEEPKELTPLARRVLREIPGAVKVSDWQVVIPGPGNPRRYDQTLDRHGVSLVAGPVDLPGHLYGGVTAFGVDAFPAWLREGVLSAEEKMAENGSQPVGSTDMGVLVDLGTAELACTLSGDEPPPGSDCAPTVVSRVGEDLFLQWSMGTEDFLTAGADMEVFLSDDYSTDTLATIGIAGLDGTEVARAEFVSTTGETVQGTVESGTLAEGDSLFYGRVPGELARVVAYDADGNVIEDHQLRTCDSPVDCEVR